MRYQWLLWWLLGVLAYSLALECETTWGNNNCVFSFNDPYVTKVMSRMFMERFFCWTKPGLTGIFSPRDSQLLILLPCWVGTVISLSRLNPSHRTVSECCFGSAFPNSNFKHKKLVSVQSLCSLWRRSRPFPKGDFMLQSSLGFPGLHFGTKKETWGMNVVSIIYLSIDICVCVYMFPTWKKGETKWYLRYSHQKTLCVEHSSPKSLFCFQEESPGKPRFIYHLSLVPAPLLPFLPTSVFQHTLRYCCWDSCQVGTLVAETTVPSLMLPVWGHLTSPESELMNQPVTSVWHKVWKDSDVCLNPYMTEFFGVLPVPLVIICSY